jgi:hypothetical protein
MNSLPLSPESVKLQPVAPSGLLFYFVAFTPDLAVGYEFF